MRQSLVIAVCFSLSSGLALAQGSGEAPKPGPEHKKLGYFVGKWTAESEVKPNPFMPGGKMTSHDSCEWFEGGFAVVCRYEGKGPTGPTKGLGIMGYNADVKAYTYYGLDNGPQIMASVPMGKVEGGAWIYDDESKMGGKTVKSRYTIKEASPTSYTFKWEMLGENGAWQTIMEGKSTKAS